MFNPLDTKSIFNTFHFTYEGMIEDLSIKYIQGILEPISNELKNCISIADIYKHIDNYYPKSLGIDIQIDINEFLSKLIDVTSLDEYKNFIIYAVINYLIKEIFKQLNNTILVKPKDIFISIFNNDKIRWLLFNICPSPFPEDTLTNDQVINISKSLPDDNIDNQEIADIINKVTRYLKKVYKGRAAELINHFTPYIDIKYTTDNLSNLVIIVIVMLRKNIRLKDWDLNNPMFYISSLYDNSIVNLEATLSVQI
jgi:hypothetical protein